MSLVNVAVIVAMAAAAPLVARAVPRGVVPGIVVELLAGLIVGPHGLGWIAIDGPADTLALLGVAFLFFLAGLEIDLGVIRGLRPRAVAGRVRRRPRPGAGRHPRR